MRSKKIQQKYIIGIYVRESRDENEENIETIETQRDLLVDFVDNSGLGEIYRIYMDDNVSGSVFEREGIQNLKSDVMTGRINMLVLKDLSRLGRNNAKTLLFLDFLEEYGIRVITFDGRYDSYKDNDTVGIETWFNERYVRDISRKIRTNLRFKIEKGEYIGHAPYGYKKSEEQKNRLCIDESTAPVVKEIYSLYRNGYGYAYIAKVLDKRGYDSPSGEGKWNAVAVQRILKNRVYIGDTIQGISEKISFKSKKTRRLPQNRWVVTPDTHDAIISRQEFDEIQKIIERRRHSSGPHKGKIHLLRGMLYCGKCGSIMFARVRKDRPDGYICSNYSKNGRRFCSSHYIKEEFIKDIICAEIKELFEDKEAVWEAEKMLIRDSSKKEEYSGRIDKLEQQLRSKQKQQENLYMDKLEGRISEQLFSRVNNNLESRIELLKKEIDRIKQRSGTSVNTMELICKMKDDICKNGLTHEMLEVMVDKIVIYDADDCVENPDTWTLQDDDRKREGAVIIDFKYK